MIKKLVFTVFCMTLLTMSAFSQNFYYSPEGKTYLNVSTEKLIVKFADGTDYDEQRTILQQEQFIVQLERDMLLTAPELTIVDLHGITNTDQVYNLIERLEENNQVLYANHFLAHKDGTLHGVMDRVVVRLKSETDKSKLDNYLSQYNAKIELKNRWDNNIYQILLNPGSNLNALELANVLHETGEFDFSEPDFLRIMDKFNTNDPYVDDQWSLNNDGNNTASWGGIAGADMKVFDAWGTTTGNSSISVAILDEGVDLNHPDLVGNLLGGYDATGQGSAGGPQGDDAHGTACAGIVAAVGNNNLGIAGVAYDSKIVPVRIAYSNAQGNWVTSNTWIGNAINWAWDQGGADILSNSWGGGGSSSTINNAIDNAISNGRGGLGCPVLFAAGNDNGANSYPATYEPTISVIAMSMCNQRKNPSSCDGETWWGSNYGTGADIAAPGVKIYATDISGSAGYSSGDYISNFNGTSSATPNASGVVALLLSQDSGLTEDEARVALESTADKAGSYSYSNVSGQPNGTWSNELGYGRVNAIAALNTLTPPANDDAGIASVNDPSGNMCTTDINPNVDLRNYGANTLSSVTINYSVDGGANQTYNWTGSLASGSTTSVSLPTMTVSSGSHTFSASTSNPNGNTDPNPGNDDASSSFYSGSNGLTLSITLDNYPEETSWDLKDSGGNTLASGGTYGSQPDGSTINIAMCVADGCYDFTIYDVYGDGICCGYGSGSYTLTEDATGNTLASGGSFGSSETTNFCVTSGPPPLSVSASGSDASCNGGSDGSASASASGGTGSYSYSWSNGDSGANVTGLSAGTYTVTVDDGNSTASTSITIGEPSVVSVSASSTDDNGSNNGTATASASGGTPGYSYSWSNGDSGATITGLAAGTYNVTATDNNGCSASTSVVVNLGTPALSVNITGSSDVSCNGGSDGIATASASGGSGSYTYSWSNGESGASAFSLSAGTHNVTVDDGNTTASTSVTINEPSALSVSTSSTDSDGSDNGTATASASGGTPGYSYAWSNGASGSTIGGLAPGTYSVTVTDANGCTETASAVVDLDAGGCNYVVLNSENFDSNWGIWNDGGSDCRRNRNDAPYASSGTRCVRLRDNTNTSVMTTDDQDYSAYSELTVDFGYYPRSMDNGNEDFWLQISTDGGATFTTVEEWNKGDEFENDAFYTDAVVIPGPFSANTRLRFRCDASGNSDWVYIDDVVISGCEGVGGSNVGTPEKPKEEVTINETETSASISGLSLYPNPSKNLLNLEVTSSDDMNIQIYITDLNGSIVHKEMKYIVEGKNIQQVQVDRLKAGVYFIHLISENNKIAKQFIKVE